MRCSALFTALLVPLVAAQRSASLPVTVVTSVAEKLVLGTDRRLHTIQSTTLITSTLPPAPAAAATSVSTAPDTRGTPTPVWEIFGEQEDQEQEDGEYWLDDEEWECDDEYYEEEGGIEIVGEEHGQEVLRASA